MQPSPVFSMKVTPFDFAAASVRRSRTLRGSHRQIFAMMGRQPGRIHEVHGQNGLHDDPGRRAAPASTGPGAVDEHARQCSQHPDENVRRLVEEEPRRRGRCIVHDHARHLRQLSHRLGQHMIRAKQERKHYARERTKIASRH